MKNVKKFLNNHYFRSYKNTGQTCPQKNGGRGFFGRRKYGTFFFCEGNAVYLAQKTNNKSINQSINQTINQSINQSNN